MSTKPKMHYPDRITDAQALRLINERVQRNHVRSRTLAKTDPGRCLIRFSRAYGGNRWKGVLLWVKPQRISQIMWPNIADSVAIRALSKRPGWGIFNVANIKETLIRASRLSGSRDWVELFDHNNEPIHD